MKIAHPTVSSTLLGIAALLLSTGAAVAQEAAVGGSVSQFAGANSDPSLPAGKSALKESDADAENALPLPLRRAGEATRDQESGAAVSSASASGTGCTWSDDQAPVVGDCEWSPGNDVTCGARYGDYEYFRGHCSGNVMARFCRVLDNACPSCYTYSPNNALERFSWPLSGHCKDSRGRHYGSIACTLESLGIGEGESYANFRDGAEACAGWCANYPESGFVGFMLGGTTGTNNCVCLYTRAAIHPNAQTLSQGEGPVVPDRVAAVANVFCYPVSQYIPPGGNGEIETEHTIRTKKLALEERVDGERPDGDADAAPKTKAAGKDRKKTVAEMSISELEAELAAAEVGEASDSPPDGRSPFAMVNTIRALVRDAAAEGAQGAVPEGEGVPL